MARAASIMQEKINQVVVISSFHAAEFNRLKRFKRDNFKTGFQVIFVLHDELPSTYVFEVKHEITENPLFNVVGLLPGKSKKDEYVIFSAHYDHLGVGKPNAASDSIYNGANDDASGTAAVIMLAKHFAMGPTGVFIAIPLTEVLVTTVAYIFFRRGKWKKVVV